MPDVSPAPVPPQPAPGIFWNPYVQIFLTVVLTAAAQILLKIGGNGSAGDDSIWSWLGVKELASWWTWLGIISLIGSFGPWLYALRFLPLGIAFGLTNAVQVFVPLGSWFILHERIGPLRAFGIMIIIIGVVLLAKSVARVEERL